MSACNQILGAAKKVTMIRRMKSRKNVISGSKKVQPTASVVHQTNNLPQATTLETIAEVPRYMNTYRLESKHRFNCVLVRSVLEEILHKHCSKVKYDPLLCVSKAKFIAGEITKRVKNFQFDRYRVIVLVHIGENSGQDFETAVKFLWDSSKDKFVTCNLNSGSMFTSATCFGIYLD